jgi:hypothetical protein
LKKAPRDKTERGIEKGIEKGRCVEKRRLTDFKIKSRKRSPVIEKKVGRKRPLADKKAGK